MLKLAQETQLTRAQAEESIDRAFEQAGHLALTMKDYAVRQKTVSEVMTAVALNVLRCSSMTGSTPPRTGKAVK